HLREHPEFLQGKGYKRLQSDIRDLVQTLEPETSRERAERAARSRHVTMTPLADGMARVTAVLRGIDAVALMHSLRTRAESLRASGAKDAPTALEADLLVDDVLRAAQRDEQRIGNDDTAHDTADDGTAHDGTANDHAVGDDDTRDENHAATHHDDLLENPGGERPQGDDVERSCPARPRLRPGLDVGIVITDTALLEGYGSSPAHIGRDTLLGRPPGHLRSSSEEEHPDEAVSAFFRRLYRSPRTGDLIAMESRARAFPAELARMIRWRDTTCR